MGLIVLDAGVVIGVLDTDDPHHQTSLAALGRCLDRRDELVVPASVYAETLVGPYRRGAGSVSRLDRFYLDMAIRIEPLTAVVAHEAARLRAIYGNRLRLPDALVVATARRFDAGVLTTDARWPSDLSDDVIVVGPDGG